MSTTPNPDDLRSQRLAPNPAGADDSERTYYVDDGIVVFRGYPVRHADLNTFEFWSGGFAKDARACYCVGRRLTQATPTSFRALNFTYATDGDRVWCLGGEVKGVNSRAFRVCDDGRYDLGKCIVPHGYARDDNAVFFYNFDGKANVVRNSDPGTFQSLGDGIFGLDRNHVFMDGRRHTCVQRATWRKIGGYYNTDGKAVLYGDRLLDEADLATFRILGSNSGEFTWAKDNHRRYHHGRELSEHYVDLWNRDAIDDV